MRSRRRTHLARGSQVGNSGPQPVAGAGLWIRADRVGLGALSAWTDISGSGNTPVQATGSKQPVNTLGAGPQANLPGVVYTAASLQFLQVANAIIGTKNFTVALVGKVLSTGVSGVFASAGTSGNGTEFGVDTRGTSRRDFNANGVVAVSDTTSVASTNWEAWIFTSDAGGNLSLVVNGSAHALDTATATALTPSAIFTVGSLGGSGGFLNGAVWEVIAYPTALNAGGVTALAAYQQAVTKLW